jgi:hypothetical protein
MVATAYPRKFVPQDLKVDSFADVEPFYHALLARARSTPPPRSNGGCSISPS